MKLSVVLQASEALEPEQGTMPREDEDDLRWVRAGHIDQGRLCDRLVTHAVRALHGQTMPARWRMGVDRLPGVAWSRTTSYHMLLVNGNPVFRIWTNTDADYAWTDVQHTLCPNIVADVEPIPSGNLKKCKPFVWRFKLQTEEEVDLLIADVRWRYGLDNT